MKSNQYLFVICVGLAIISLVLLIKIIMPTSPAPQTTVVDDFKTFTSTYGFEFKYPKKLDLKETKIPGEKGFAYCLDFSKAFRMSFADKALAGAGGCYSSDFGAGATSIDFEAGRMGGFLDTRGYIFKNNIVTYKFTSTKNYVIPQDLIGEVTTNKNGVEIVKIIGKDEESENHFPVAGTPGDGYIGAIINLPNSSLTGIGFIYNRSTNLLTEDEFNQILETIKYTSQ